MKKQKGIVLFLSLIVLILMTVIGVALAVNSTQSMRMSGAGSDRIGAMASAIGAQDKVIVSQQGKIMANMSAVTTVEDAAFGVINTFTPMVSGDVTCQRSSKASSSSLIMCRRVEVSSEAKFGRDGMGRLTVVAGIEQEVLTGS